MRHPLVLGPALLCAAACLAGCGTGAREDRRRAVVIGIDSADWKVIDALVAEGRMPNLASLRERGSSGPIRTPCTANLLPTGGIRMAS